MITGELKLNDKEEVKFKEICNSKALVDCSLHSSGCKLCYKFAIKRYYFIDYSNKGSYKA